jgi:hypothetical protein
MRTPLPLLLSCLLPLHAALATDDALFLKSPSDAEVVTEVTGQGEDRGVSWPEGPAAMTPLWLVAQGYIRWACEDGHAVRLEVRAGRGPDARARSIDLSRHQLYGGFSEVPLYLWEVAEVKAACKEPGDVRVDSVPVHLTLECPKGRLQRATRSVALQVRCRPSEPSREAVTGVAGSESQREEGPNILNMLPKFAHHRVSLSGTWLLVGQRQTLELGRVGPQLPALQGLRVVRLDAAGKVVERFAPERLLDAGTDEARYEPRVTLTPKEAGTLRLALEAEYPDGSRMLSAPAEVRVETRKQRAEREARRPTSQQRLAVLKAVEERMKANRQCGAELVAWLKQLPHVEDAGDNGHNAWLRFTDGIPLVISCH